MRCVKLLGQRLMARDFDGQVAEVKVRIAVLNGCTALDIHITKALPRRRLGNGEHCPSAELCNGASETCLEHNLKRGKDISGTNLEGLIRLVKFGG